MAIGARQIGTRSLGDSDGQTPMIADVIIGILAVETDTANPGSILSSGSGGRSPGPILMVT